MVNEEIVREALKDVYDPEIGINIIDLGLVYNVEVKENKVDIEMTLTSMGCPVGPILIQQIEEVIGSLPGVEEVNVQLVWTPPWNPSMMSEDAKLELGFA
ncbi:protein of unknown function DUF59 [Thermobaculum terrenum ATCC BAA-798]|uniref:MIP18 family-like domain-containing protein n=1 Tax=Thermobaculum terrenum (strain ATCC BAA-798 / CCMEE 7001 / YNP1) TaxID=525904 RepID=D1CD74_THET1|nr:iron-sulfur cluster assembly protein [Thermobaculum terrenum]ACZ42739.1 protein of unknown function DUF59 [Thermobaculum terrenum ATCC BAA-798]